jgi:hypothetical protein
MSIPCPSGPPPSLAEPHLKVHRAGEYYNDSRNSCGKCEDGYIAVKTVKRPWDTMRVDITLAAFGLPSPSPGQLTAAKSSMNFGNVQTGTSATHRQRDYGFSISGMSAPITLAPDRARHSV